MLFRNLSTGWLVTTREEAAKSSCANNIGPKQVQEKTDRTEVREIHKSEKLKLCQFSE